MDAESAFSTHRSNSKCGSDAISDIETVRDIAESEARCQITDISIFAISLRQDVYLSNSEPVFLTLNDSNSKRVLHSCADNKESATIESGVTDGLCVVPKPPGKNSSSFGDDSESCTKNWVNACSQNLEALNTVQHPVLIASSGNMPQPVV